MKRREHWDGLLAFFSGQSEYSGLVSRLVRGREGDRGSRGVGGTGGLGTALGEGGGAGHRAVRERPPRTGRKELADPGSSGPSAEAGAPAQRRECSRADCGRASGESLFCQGGLCPLVPCGHLPPGFS